MKKIIICADDYGQNRQISQGIIKLAKARRLSAISSMVNIQYWQVAAGELVKLKDLVDLGLHFNLTFGSPVSTKWQEKYGDKFFSLAKLIILSFAGKLDLVCVHAELTAQLELFIKTLGFLPSFIDGHQHIHHLPGIREVLIEVYQQIFDSKNCYLRIADLRDDKSFKSKVINVTGARQLKQMVLNNKIAHNSSFAGVYNFKQAHLYEKHFNKWLAKIASGCLLMCHPGDESQDLSDPIASSRYLEYQYFISDAFIENLQENDCTLARFKEINHAL